MSHLPSLTDSLARLKQEVANLRRGKQGAHSRPHKLVMLLSVIELADRKMLTKNKIYLSPQLLAIFENFFVLVKRKNDLCQPGSPFFTYVRRVFGFIKCAQRKKKIMRC
ncbi:MAG: hypothetical protein WHV44_01370 [Anaerolineales bacterium]